MVEIWGRLLDSTGTDRASVASRGAASFVKNAERQFNWQTRKLRSGCLIQPGSTIPSPVWCS